MPTITVDNNPAEPIVEPKSGIEGDDIAARRRALFAKFDQSAEAQTLGTLDPEHMTGADREPPREEFETLTLQTPAGTIEFGPPSGVSITMRIAMMMGEDNPNRVQSAMLRTLMAVRSVNGQAVVPITSMVGAQALANLLGDSVLDYLFDVHREYWPPPRKGDLQILRKNKRVS